MYCFVLWIQNETNTNTSKPSNLELLHNWNLYKILNMKYLFMKNCEAQAKSKYQILCSKNPKSLPSSNKRDMDWG